MKHVWITSSRGIAHAFVYWTREVRSNINFKWPQARVSPVWGGGPVSISHCGTRIPDNVKASDWGGKAKRKCIRCTYIVRGITCRSNGGTGRGTNGRGVKGKGTTMWDLKTIDCERRRQG